MLKYLTLFMMFLFSVQLIAADQGPSPATLYYSPNCGHCKKVLAYLKEQHKTVIMKDVTDKANNKEFQATGSSTVPVLVINGQSIKGADTIIDYFKQHPEVLR